MNFDVVGGLCAQALPNKRALVVAHENITNNYYPGNNRSCLVSNCLFRVGGAACLLSNRCLSSPDAFHIVACRRLRTAACSRSRELHGCG